MRRFRTFTAVAALLTAGCLDTTGSNSIILNFDFTNPSQALGEGWTSGVADVPADRVADVQVISSYRNLPTPWESYKGIEHGGTSVDGNAFVFHKKWIQTAWSSGTRFTVKLSLTFMSDRATACPTGPGLSVFLKAGLSQIEPLANPDASGVLRLNLDKGTASSGGLFPHFGNITNGNTDCPTEATWAYKEVGPLNQVETLTIDENGGFWVFMGTQSTFSGSHDIYLLALVVNLTPDL